MNANDGRTDHIRVTQGDGEVMSAEEMAEGALSLLAAAYGCGSTAEYTQGVIERATATCREAGYAV